MRGRPFWKQRKMRAKAESPRTLRAIECVGEEFEVRPRSDWRGPGV